MESFLILTQVQHPPAQSSMYALNWTYFIHYLGWEYPSHISFRLLQQQDLPDI